MYAAMADSERAIQLLLNLSAAREQVFKHSQTTHSPVSFVIAGLFWYRLMLWDAPLSTMLPSLVTIRHSSCLSKLELVGPQSKP